MSLPQDLQPKNRQVPAWSSLGITSPNPVFLAPLAGVSDHPFRRVCAARGADLTYVEMISAAALIHNSERTFGMLKRHSSEGVLGVQVTGRSADETAEAIGILDRLERFDTIDINMGCPVQKVVKSGCGSAILKDPRRVFETLQKSRKQTTLPLTAKIRLGWDRNSLNGVEVAKAVEEGGADWLTVHGRTRSDDYGVAVDLEAIAEIKAAVKIPVLGNGNLFSVPDAKMMLEKTGVDGLMLSRGALGDPWLFARIKGRKEPLHRDEWLSCVRDHVAWQAEEYGSQGSGAVCLRKHLLWYAKGWTGVKHLREALNCTEDLSLALKTIEEFCETLYASGVEVREDAEDFDRSGQRFRWDPKFEMDRILDRGVGDDGLVSPG